MLGMDRRAHREEMLRWIELGRIEGLTFARLSKRSGFHVRTLRRWTSRLRGESVLREADPSAQRPGFVELVARPQGPATAAIEIVLGADRRIVVIGEVDGEALLRVVRVLERC